MLLAFACAQGVCVRVYDMVRSVVAAADSANVE